MKSGAAVVFLACFLIVLPACAESPRVCFKDACYIVEIARTPEARARGLMGRDRLNPGTGMLFLFDADGRYGFWMKNMKFPIDILWLDSEIKTVYIAENVPPCLKEPCQVTMPPQAARYVLEIPASDAAVHKIKLSDQAQLQGAE